MDKFQLVQSLHNLELQRYPRTAHLQGSRLQDGDEGHDQAPYSTLAGQYIVVEEKFDGANSAISFDAGGELLLQSRGHYLTGGAKERQFGMFKRWASAHESTFLEVLEDRFVMYGEMMAKKHSVYYDNLPHIFLEFDVYDRKNQCFLSTLQRKQLLKDLPVLSVPVLYEGLAPKTLKELLSYLKPSLARTLSWRESFELKVQQSGLNLDKAWSMCDKSDLAEGLYLKVESLTQVLERYKWVRADFVQTILDTNVHHSQQPFIANGLNPRVDLYAPQLAVTWETL